VIVPDVVLDVNSGREFRPAPLGGMAMGGKVGTVDELIVDPSRLAGLAEQGVIALEMESTGVASVCEDRGLPWSVVRVISDRPDDGYTDDAVLGTLRPDGSADMRAALRLMATRPSRIPGLVRLGRDSSMAAGRAAKTTLEALG
jgi:adenosylhomocysteine nucleosidase